MVVTFKNDGTDNLFAGQKKAVNGRPIIQVCGKCLAPILFFFPKLVKCIMASHSPCILPPPSPITKSIEAVATTSLPLQKSHACPFNICAKRS